MWILWRVSRAKSKMKGRGGARINKRRVGEKYEKIASDYLENQGYTIVEQNLRTPYGEVDILAKEGSSLVFCEVKYRSSAKYGSPMEAVGTKKQRRISRAALYYYAKNGFSQDVPCRFDVIAVCGDGGVEHLENAFEFQH